MKTHVFIFVPVTSESNFQERLHDCLTSLPDSVVVRTLDEEKTVDSPFWTWFLPNPLPPPRQTPSDQRS
jgi:hypothetical protein